MNHVVFGEMAAHIQKSEAVYFKVSASLDRIMFDENKMMFYLACPKCKKKVSEQNEKFRCENCD